MNLGAAFIRARKAKGLTQKKVAQGVGISERNYQDYEYGKVEPVASKLIAIANFLDVSIDYLVGLSDDPARH